MKDALMFSIALGAIGFASWLFYSQESNKTETENQFQNEMERVKAELKIYKEGSDPSSTLNYAAERGYTNNLGWQHRHFMDMVGRGELEIDLHVKSIPKANQSPVVVSSPEAGISARERVERRLGANEPLVITPDPVQQTASPSEPLTPDPVQQPALPQPRLRGPDAPS